MAIVRHGDRIMKGNGSRARITNPVRRKHLIRSAGFDQSQTRSPNRSHSRRLQKGNTGYEHNTEFMDHCRMSPSSEIDLSHPEFERDLRKGTSPKAESFTGHGSLIRDGHVDHRMQPNRYTCASLEADEKGFLETAEAVRCRGMSLHGLLVQVLIEVERTGAMVSTKETLEKRHQRDQELACKLFGDACGVAGLLDQNILSSSPVITPKENPVATSVTKVTITTQEEDDDMTVGSRDLDNTEKVELDELSSLLSGF